MFEICERFKSRPFENAMADAVIEFCGMHGVDLKYYLQASTKKNMEMVIASNKKAEGVE